MKEQNLHGAPVGNGILQQTPPDSISAVAIALASRVSSGVVQSLLASLASVITATAVVFFQYLLLHVHLGINGEVVQSDKPVLAHLERTRERVCVCACV